LTDNTRTHVAYALTETDRHMAKASKSKVSAFAKAASKATPSGDNGDEFDPGKYRVRFVDCAEGEGGAFKTTFAGCGKDAKVGERIQWFSTKGKSLHVSAGRVKAMCMALVGAEDEETYDAFDPHGEFISAIMPYDAEAAAEYLVEAGKAKSTEKAQAKLESTEITIKVTRGSDKDDGGFFRNAAFSAADVNATADEDEQDEDAEEDEDAEPESERRPAKAKPGKVSKRKPAPEPEDEEEDEDTDAEDEDEDPPSERPAKRKPSKAKPTRR
jgi:hypothetical protein